MKNIFLIFIIFLITLNADVIKVDENSSNIFLTGKSSYFLDQSGKVKKRELVEQFFQKHSSDTLTLGFNPNANLWIKFTLNNDSNKTLSKTIVYTDADTETIHFYDENSSITDGMFHISEKRTSIYPAFSITLKPFETKTFYIMAHSDIVTLIAELKLYNPDEFIRKDYKRKIYLTIFFTVLGTLFVYNFMLYVFTREKAYLYYILYLASLIFFQANYLGVLQLTLFSNEISAAVTKASLIYISLLMMTIVLFTRESLNTIRFTKIDLILKGYLFITPIIALLSYDNFFFTMKMIPFFIPLGFTVIFVGFYALYKGVEQAKYYVFGLCFVIISLIFTNLKTFGIYNVTPHFPYFNEFAFFMEALLFSVMLAYKIRILSEKKIEADGMLIQIQQKKQQELQELVKIKTANLKSLFEEQEILYKELSHRVKNNLQMILSLIKLQINKTVSNETKTALSIAHSRIKSISDIYEQLHLEKNSTSPDTQEYFSNIIKNIGIHFEKNAQIVFDIKYQLGIDSIIYCGLILNEAVTNSFKYAFEIQGVITIKLFEEADMVNFIIEDNGIGFHESSSTSLGLTIMKALAEKQLFGSFDIDSKKHTKIIVKWKKYEKA